jgi:threonine dehydratase
MRSCQSHDGADHGRRHAGQARLAGGVAVTRQEVFRAVRLAFEHLKVVAEPGGAVALAALLAGKVDAEGKRSAW